MYKYNNSTHQEKSLATGSVVFSMHALMRTHLVKCLQDSKMSPCSHDLVLQKCERTFEIKDLQLHAWSCMDLKLLAHKNVAPLKSTGFNISLLSTS